MLDRFPYLAQRLFNTPLMITPHKAEIILAALGERLGLTQIVHANGDVIFAGEEMRSTLGADMKPSRDVGYDVIEGVAVIPVEGTLVNRLGCLRPYSGMTGYDGIRQNLLAAVADTAVRAIVFDIDSPGGDVAGCYDLVDTIYAARSEKPIWAIVNEQACSAGYAIGSAATRMILPRTGLTGSIGVLYMHYDVSQMLKDAGVKVTFITYGAAKSDCWPEIPLSAAAKARIQERIDFVGDLFCDTVARNRKVKASVPRNTQAAVLGAEEAMKLGLIDAVMSPDAAFASLLKSLN